MKINRNLLFKILFSLIGLLSLSYIVNQYGVDLLYRQLKQARFGVILLIGTFVPTLILYSTSWFLLTETKKDTFKNTINGILRFSKYTLISLSWNNLTPFLKVGGEPLKYFMLSKHMTKSRALASTINYNIIHICATLLAFVIAGFIISVFYHPNQIFNFSIILITLLSFALLAGFFSLFFVSKKGQLVSRLLPGLKFREKRINLLKAIRSLRFYLRKHPYRLFLALILDTAARFVEGMTFFVAFLLIGREVSLHTGFLLDVVRTIVDTLLFFIPYQLGGREEGLRLAMENIFMIGSTGFLWISFSYRFVEIFWIIIGYFFSIKEMRSSKEKIIIS